MLLNINTLLWVMMFYAIFGPNTGVQHFIFALILVDLLLDRKHPIPMILGLYVVRVGLYVEKTRINDASTARTNSLRDNPDFQEHMRKMSAATQRHRAELIRKIKKGEIKNV